MQFESDLCEFMEWIHDWYSVVEKHAQTMLQLLEFGMRGMCWETWRTGADRESQIVEEIAEVNFPVPQIVEEIAEVSKSLIVWSSILKLYFVEIEVFPA